MKNKRGLEIFEKVFGKNADIHWDQIAAAVIALVILFIAVVAIGLYREEIVGVVSKIMRAIKLGGVG